MSADVRSPEDGSVEEFRDPLQKKEEKREPSAFLTTKEGVVRCIHLDQGSLLC